MNLHHLSIFRSIADTGSISGSSRNLHISQPALSRELKTFEQRLGVTLFERQPRGMRLTQAGEVLHAYAVRLFDLEKAAESAIREVAGARHGRLSLAASNTIGTYVLPRVLATFTRQRPDVRVSLFVGNTAQVAEGVADLRFMLGFIEGPLHVEGVRSATFQDDELIPVVAAGHALARRKRLAPGAIIDQQLLMRERGSGTREVIASMLKTLDVGEDGHVMEFGNTEALKQAAIHGGGIAWLPKVSVSSELGSGVLAELKIPSLRIRRPFQVIMRDSAPSSPLIHALLDMLHVDLPVRSSA